MKALTLALLASGALVASVTVAQAQAALAIPDPIIKPEQQDLYLVNQPPSSPPPQPQPVPNGQPPQWPYGYLGSYIWPSPYAALEPPEPPRIARVLLPEMGSLRFESIPLSAQVFVDGAYAGRVEDFGPDEHTNALTSGVHTVEVRAEGFEPLAFHVNIEPNRVLRYTGTMRRIASPGPIARVSAAPKALYVIPKCYAGDKPPAGPLPPGCSEKNMRIRQP